MKKWLWIVFFPCFLQAVAPPMDFHQEPPAKISPEIRNQWMDGPEALAKEAVRNEKIFAQHQFPLGKVLIFSVALALIWALVSQRKVISSWMVLRKPLTPKEKAKKRLKEIEKMPNLKDRYRLLGLTVRENLKDRYRIPALVSTNKEVLEDLETSREQYREVFDEVESVGFQNKRPTDTDYQKMKNQVKKLLK